MPATYHLGMPREERKAAHLPELADSDGLPDPVDFANPPTGIARWREVASKSALVMALFYVTYLGAAQFLG